MKKFFFFPLWNVEKIENELTQLEQNGWRLDRISFFHCFHFVEASPKKTSYFFTYKLIKENGMADVEHYLKSKLGANPVKGELDAIWQTAYVYRMESGPDLEKPRFYRNIYLQHLVGQQILFGMLIPFISVLCLMGKFIFSGIGPADAPELLSIGVMNVIPLCYSVYQFLGLSKIKKEYKKMLPDRNISFDDFLCN